MSSDIGSITNNCGNAEKRPVRSVRSYSLASPEIFKFTIEGYNYGINNPSFVADDDVSNNSRRKRTINTEDKLHSEYNPFDHVDIKHPTSFWGTTFHLVFLSVGSPVLLMPNKFVAAGYIGGTISMFLVFSFYVYCMRKMLWSAYEICKLKRVPSMTYTNLIYEAFNSGPHFVQFLASFCSSLTSYIFVVGWYGTCVLIYVLIVQNMRSICSSWMATDFSQLQMVLIVFIPLLILNLIRKLKYLEPCSTIGFFFNFVAILLVFYYSITDSADWKIKYQTGSLDAVPLLVGTVFFNINITGIIISLQNEMKHPKKFEAPVGVMSIAYGIILASFFLFSVFFSLKYGAGVPINAIDLVPPNLFLSLITGIFYVCGHFLLFPLIFYVPLEVMWTDVLKGDKNLSSFKLVWEYLLRFFLLAFAAFLTYIHPDISFFMSLSGTIGSSIDSIMLPAVVESIVLWKIGRRGKEITFTLLTNLLIFIMGLGLLLSGIYDCVKLL